MLTLHTRLARAGRIDDEAVLPFEGRERCRLRIRLASGREAALLLPRGTVLRDGDLLTGPEGAVVRVRAAPEATYRIEADDARALLRCAFHLGNRHSQVQLGAGCLRIRADPVLREMLLGLGARVTEEPAPFDPESGAYGGGHSHEHGPRHLLAPVPLRQKIHRPGDADSA
ncbi:urease accessory protein UreE [Massilia sp. G4R7]|uniref:Urease accessory protein UreE n=1 Tax=Massilia phyllostachyos TaxID=2898585 RepID=A0ABS8Q6X3_9BURK|nr:urease accessory protein UreE [Massilia phyllostachyos]MCD2517497.1 urease accessory protein UreE [Massilia phyllostachyos]